LAFFLPSRKVGAARTAGRKIAIDSSPII